MGNKEQHARTQCMIEKIINNKKINIKRRKKWRKSDLIEILVYNGSKEEQSHRGNRITFLSKMKPFENNHIASLRY